MLEGGWVRGVERVSSPSEKKKKAAFWKCCRPSEGECGLCMFHKILKITAYAPHSVLSSLQAGVKVRLGCTWRKWTSLPFFFYPLSALYPIIIIQYHGASRDSWGLPGAKEWEVEEEEWRHVMAAGCKELGTSSSILGETWKAANFRHRYRKDLENVVHITSANAKTKRVSVVLVACTPSSAYSLACGFDGLD